MTRLWISYYPLFITSLHVMNSIRGDTSSTAYNMESVPANKWTTYESKPASSPAVCAKQCRAKEKKAPQLNCGEEKNQSLTCDAFQMDGDLCLLGSYDQNDGDNSGENATIWKKKIIKEEVEGDVIFIAGSETTEVLDLYGSCSRPTCNLPEQREYSSMHLVDNQLLICGGVGHSTCIKSTDPAQGVWKHHSDLTVVRYEHSGVMVNSTLYLVGSRKYGSSSSMEKLDKGSTTWIQGPNPKAYQGICTAADQEGRYIYSSWNSRTTKKLDLITNKWSYVGSNGQGNLRYFRYHACTMAKINGKQVLIAGGSYYNEGNPLIMDTETEVWSQTEPFNMPRAGYGKMVNLNGRVLFLGGKDKIKDTYYTSVEELDLEKLTWSTLNVAMKEARPFFSATVVPRSMVCN